MNSIRILDSIWEMASEHLSHQHKERFAFFFGAVANTGNAITIVIHDVLLIPDEKVSCDEDGFVVQPDAVLDAVNRAHRDGSVLIEIHSHRFGPPKFSEVDLLGLEQVVPFILRSLKDRPFVALVYAEGIVAGNVYRPNGQAEAIEQVLVVGEELRSIISREICSFVDHSRFNRQAAWFTRAKQAHLSTLRVGIGGLGGLGAPLAINLAMLGVMDFYLFDDDRVDPSNLNRLPTATVGDTGKLKADVAAQMILRLSPAARCTVINRSVQDRSSIQTAVGLDLMIGCFDNDGARMLWNEVAVCYRLPYVDLGVGIQANEGRVQQAGGRVAVVRPGGPCLRCMSQIDYREAAYFSKSVTARQEQRVRGYAEGLDEVATAVGSLNAVIAGLAVTEIAAWASGVRTPSPLLEYDALGDGRAIPAQWVTPVRVPRKACIVCESAGTMDRSSILERYGVDDEK